MTIAVTGAGGKLGHLVFASLKGRVSPSDLIALDRSLDKAQDLGVEVRSADYDKPDVLDSALKGVKTLLLISSLDMGRRPAQHANVINAAKRQGVERIVYTSLLHADTSQIDFAWEHVETEALLKTSGLGYTLMRNSWYTENYTGLVKPSLARGFLAGAAGDGKITTGSRADYAEAAAIVLTSDGHTNKTYELAGDKPYTLSDLAGEISRQAAKTVPYQDMTQDDYAALLAGSGLPPGLAKSIAQWDVAASEGSLFDEGHVLSRLIGRPTTSLSESVAAALQM